MVRVSAVAVRVRRVSTKIAYVHVPLTEALMEDLGRGTEGTMLINEACRLAAAAETEWTVEEEPFIEVHPIQQPQPR